MQRCAIPGNSPLQSCHTPFKDVSTPRGSKLRVILSHPYSGALHWWMQSANEWAHSTRPDHPYYRHLYGKVNDHLDVALACTVIFDEIILPAADAQYPESTISADYRKVEIPSLGLLADWDPVQASRKALENIAGDIAKDIKISRILAKVPKHLRAQVVLDVATDMLLQSEYKAPVISSSGRRAMLVRLAELGILADLGVPTKRASSTSGAGNKPPETLATIGELTNYVSVTGLSFRSPDIKTLSDIKSNSTVRNYAKSFQNVLIPKKKSTATVDLFDSIRQAWKSQELQNRISGGFTTTSRAFSVLGLIPGIGTIAEAVAMGADAGAIASEKLEQKNSWYEIGPEILRLESLAALERHLTDSTAGDH